MRTRKNMLKKLGVFALATTLAVGMFVPVTGSTEAAVTQNAKVAEHTNSTGSEQAAENTQTTGNEPATGNVQTTKAEQSAEKEQTTEGGQAVENTQTTTNTVTKKYTVGKSKYAKDYKLKNGRIYFSVKGTFPTIKDDSEAANKINEALNKEKKSLIDGWKKNASTYKAEYKLFLEDEKDYGTKVDWTYGDEITYKVTANNEQYFSVILSGYLYLGGAHGEPYRECLTFDAQTGKKLTATKISALSKKQLNAKVRKLYLAKWDKKGENAGFYPAYKDGRKELKERLKDMDFSNNFYVKNNGKIVFFTYPYNLGPYAAGFISVLATIK